MPAIPADDPRERFLLDRTIAVGTTVRLRTLHDVAAEFALRVDECRAFLAWLSNEMERRYSVVNAVPIVEHDGLALVNLHALEKALIALTDPTTPPAQYDALARRYDRRKLIDMERDLDRLGRAIFPGTRARVRQRNKRSKRGGRVKDPSRGFRPNRPGATDRVDLTGAADPTPKETTQ